MKVKELANIFNASVEELIKLLQNVGVTANVETIIEKDVERKLAKRYNVPYPFKAAKPAPKPQVAAKPAEAAGKPKEEPRAPLNTPKPNPVKPMQNAPRPSQTQSPQKPAPVAQGAARPFNPNQNPRPNFNRSNQTGNNNFRRDNNQPNNQNRPQGAARPFEQAKTHKPFEQPKPQARPTEAPKPAPAKPVVKPAIEDEIITPRIDEETLAKYEQFAQDDGFVTREKGKRKALTQEETAELLKHRKKNIKNVKHVTKENRTSNVPVASENEKGIIYYEPGMTTVAVADILGVSVTELVKKLFLSLQIMATATQALDRDTIELLAMEYGFEVKDKVFTDLTNFEKIQIIDKEDALEPRPAVVTIMGHVDHGKTTLLDTIRHSHVASGEAGGITQHIGAYQVTKNGKVITFIDTPGHAAFTEMRARGAQITDIVILVVAADDGVMPQTREAIEHAQAAKVPIIVAINKMDKPGVNPDRIKQELTKYNLVPEEWGGSTVYVNVSALTGNGVEDLLEMVILVSEMAQLKANPNRLGMGTVVEAKLDKGRGPVATLLVQNGTIKIGDVIVVGNTYGKIRAMQDEYGQSVEAAGPSKPVEITGLEEVPFAGERFLILDDERSARDIAGERAFRKFSEEKGIGKPISLNDLFNEQKDDSIKELNLIIKCDVQGSIEAIKGLLDKINIEGTQINIISARVGGITETDLNLAIASKAVVIGFNIRPTANITDMAKEKGIEIRLYDIIYKLQEDIEKAVKGMLDPVFEEKVTGQAEVRELFKVSRIGTIAGCYVTSGSIVRNCGIRLLRNSIVVYTGKLSSLKRFKDDVKEVKAGFECGLTIENFNDIKEGDIIEGFIMEEKERI